MINAIRNLAWVSELISHDSASLWPFSLARAGNFGLRIADRLS